MYVSNNERTIKTTVAEFMITQRNAGFADNDGRWNVTQLGELFWSNGGILKERRPSRFLGTFESESAALAAIDAAEPTPEHATPRWVGYPN